MPLYVSKTCINEVERHTLTVKMARTGAMNAHTNWNFSQQLNKSKNKKQNNHEFGEWCILVYTDNMVSMIRPVNADICYCEVFKFKIRDMGIRLYHSIKIIYLSSNVKKHEEGNLIIIVLTRNLSQLIKTGMHYSIVPERYGSTHFHCCSKPFWGQEYWGLDIYGLGFEPPTLLMHWFFLRTLFFWLPPHHKMCKY